METSNCFPTPAATTHDTLVCPTNNPAFEHAVRPTLIASGDVTAPKFVPSRVMMAPPDVGFEAGNRTLAMLGELYEKVAADTTVKPATVTTTLEFTPVPLGATHVKEAWSTTIETDAQPLPPTPTETRPAVLAVPKLAPVSVMTKPPDVGLLPAVGR